MKKIEKSIDLAGKKLTLSTGHIAQQASGAVMATYGETVVLVTVVGAPLKQDLGYFPLTVDYQEKLYAGGRIKGSRWVKREGRPTDSETLTARLIDRSIRPLFPKDYIEDVQVMITVLSVDLENSPDIVAGIATSAALSISDVPWNGPIGIVRASLKDDKLTSNPLVTEIESSELDLIVSSTKDAVVMIEAGANQVDEKKMLEGITYAQKECQKVIKLIDDLVKVAGKDKKSFEKSKENKSLEKRIKDLAKDILKDLPSKMATKEAGYADYDAAKKATLDSVETTEKEEASAIFDKLFEQGIRDGLVKGKRPDGRKPDQLRELSAEVGVLPRTHGSAIFKRGQTQALTVATLGAPSLEQTIETAEGEETKRYIHHYEMPPFSTGETGRVGSPKRREIGHGALAERALLPVIPDNSEFPYTIMVVTQILSSNGSTSMASTCGSTLSLMDAGVPIKAPIGGIAMGAVIEDDKNFVVLTDIVGIEDGNGDMDFKVAGSSEGITALQLDVKTLKLTLPILEKALEQAKTARLEILSVMDKAIKSPRKEVSVYAPKIKTVQIDKEKIGELIGPGGKTIKGIAAKTGAEVDVDDDGNVFVSGTDADGVRQALEMVEGITKDPIPGEIYDGEVKRMESFGAFVEILPGKDGLVHVSDMSTEFVKNPGDIVSLGDKVQVRVKEIDDRGRINLSLLLDPAEDKKKEERRGSGGGSDRRSYGGGRSFDRGRGRDNRSGGRRFGSQARSNRGDRDQRDRGGSSGPHFPTTRLLDDEKKKFDR